MARTDFHKVVIGRAEKLHFMNPLIEDIPSKTDTGAYRSAVHADNIFLSEDGKTLNFRLLGGHPVCGSLAQELSTEEYRTVRVSNSFGVEEQRYEVKLRVKLGPKVFIAAFTLADRSKKPYPILLGRKLLNDRFLVDTSHTSVDRAELKNRYGIFLPEDEESKDL